MDEAPFHKTQDECTSVHRSLCASFKISLAQIEDSKDPPEYLEGEVEEVPDTQVLDREARRAAAKIGVMLLEQGVLEVSEWSSTHGPPENFGVRYEIRCPVMKDPVEIQENMKVAQERINYLERKVKYLRRKLGCLKNDTSDEV